MPHVIVQLWPGKSEEQKTRLAQQFVRDVTKVLHYAAASGSVAIEEAEPQDWADSSVICPTETALIGLSGFVPAEEHLAYAAGEGRVLYSCNVVDFSACLRSFGARFMC